MLLQSHRVDTTKDVDWIKQCFLVPYKSARVSSDYNRTRTVTHADNKYTDTRPGGNFAINCPPQATRFADVKATNRFGNISKGMGRYYSEAIDDTTQHLHLTFGVAQYNSVAKYYSEMYNSRSGKLARTGEYGILDNIAWYTGNIVGWVFTSPALPFIWANKILGSFFNVLTDGARFLFNQAHSKYYYFKPAMVLYWKTVDAIANMIAMNMGLIEGGSGEVDAEGKVTEDLSARRAQYNRLLPDVMRSDGGIDVFAFANKAQRYKDAFERHNINEYQAGASKYKKEIITGYVNSYEAAAKGDFELNTPPKNPTMKDYMDAYTKKQISKPPLVNEDQIKKIDESFMAAWEQDTQNTSSGGSAQDTSAQVAADLMAGETNQGVGGLFGWLGDFSDYAWAEMRDGSRFVNFRLEEVGSLSESFSNGVKESDIASELNNKSATAREMKVKAGMFELGDSALGQFTQGTAEVVEAFAQGVINGSVFSGLNIIGGGAFADIPKIWDNSSADLAKIDYTFQLRAPYGNKMSIFTNIYLPLSMLLAATLPLSTGKQSYTSPFLCQAYSKGRHTIRLGIVDSLSITRGTSNCGWSVDGLPLGVDVQISITDLSSVMHMPIDDEFRPFDDDNAFTDYMAVLGALGIESQVYPWPKLMRQVNYTIQDFKSWFSPAHMGQLAGVGTLPGRMMGAFMSHAASLNPGTQNVKG